MDRRRLRFMDLTGHVYGDWTVVSHAGGRQWTCRCRCGAVARVLAYSMRQGRSSSCNNCKNLVHGLAQRSAPLSPEYRTWIAMRARCSTKNVAQWQDYGGRGIKVCERWNDPAAFVADMGLKPTPTSSIERIDNDGGYSPENCRWATRAEQMRNTRRNRFFEYNGIKLCVTDWAKRQNISVYTVYHRLRRGFDMGSALGISGVAAV